MKIPDSVRSDDAKVTSGSGKIIVKSEFQG